MLLSCSTPPSIAKECSSPGLSASGSRSSPGLSARQYNKPNAISIAEKNPITTRLKEALNVELPLQLPISSYDTAWVAMIPSKTNDVVPQFPKSLNWLLENQHPDGSWAFNPTHPLLIKESLTSTLAAILALQTWNTAPQLVDKGLDFVANNLWAVADNHQNSPFGFDIVFAGMIEYAGVNLGLNIPMDSCLVREMCRERDLKIRSDSFKDVACVAEGLIGGSYEHHWNEIIKYQRSNGSLFNSPSTTAAAFLQLRDEKCFDYLNSLVEKFDSAVPTLYPIDIYSHVSMLDNLKKLGIDRHFKEEFDTVLDDVYRSWTKGSDEIFLNTECCAMTFRLLRLNGYQVSSDVLSDYDNKEHLLHSYNNDTKSILELYKASQTSIFQIEPILDRIQQWTASHLQQALSSGSIQESSLQAEVDYALKHPYASLERIESKNYIGNYNIDNNQPHKASYRFLGIDNKDLMAYSSKDFNFCQAIHQKELEQLEGWVKKYEINSLKFARQKIRYAYFAVASDIFQPHLTDARAAWAQNSVLTTVVDDFFDFAGSMEELLNLIDLVERWDSHSVVGFKSKDVEILFNAIYGTINDTAAKAQIQQGRCVKSHLIDIWITLLRSMLMEAEWAENKTVPTMYEYLTNGYVSFALGPVVQIPLYFMGHQLPKEVVQTQEYNNLFMHMSMIGRLTNDQVSVKREGAQGKLNSVSLQVALSRGSTTEEEAQAHVSRLIESHRGELLRMVVDKKDSLIPRSCKDLFWTMSKVLHLFYMTDDAYSSPSKMVSAVDAIIDQPIIFPTY
ncbi:terpene synthase 6, chloroplastic-like [Euphorbia lathyris]|uniref:terpene synthase 6, chloroplastic-like n=1 Tax=Euphorbia lathyris TaxID=212925 RepID=UPI00331311B5